MYVSRLVIRNFRNFRSLDILIEPGVTCIVGENNTGKTNLLQAIRLPIDASLSSQYRTLLPSDFSSGCDFTTPHQVLVSLELRDYAGRENEEAMVAGWAVDDDLARVTYRFRPRPPVIEAYEENGVTGTLTLDDYRWEIVGAGGNTDPASVEWYERLGRSIRFEELQQFLVVILPPLRNVEQSLRHSRLSPLTRLISGSEIPEEEQVELVRIMSQANEDISASETISRLGGLIDESFSDATGVAFRMDVELGMAAPSFHDISRSLTVLLSDKSLDRFDPSLNGLGLNNVLYVSMLLRYFEARINAGNTPGQLLLFEEPEAHLHPQLQRVLFSTLQDKPFQTIATTHSTHITSQVPLASLAVLTDDGTPATSSVHPSSELEQRQISDLERYLDATRGTLLYARKVMLVEGPAELFLIPPLVEQVMGIRLEEHGISIIPIYGVHFASYAELFGEDNIKKKCAIIADGDLKPSDAADQSETDPEELPEFVRPELAELENEFVRVFSCQTTFERALTSPATLPMFLAATQELKAVNLAERLEELLGGDVSRTNTREARDLVLAAAKRIGKARFAQVTSKHAFRARAIPRYIRKAVNWLINDEVE